MPRFALSYNLLNRVMIVRLVDLSFGCCACVSGCMRAGALFVGPYRLASRRNLLCTHAHPPHLTASIRIRTKNTNAATLFWLLGLRRGLEAQIQQLGLLKLEAG